MGKSTSQKRVEAADRARRYRERKAKRDASRTPSRDASRKITRDELPIPEAAARTSDPTVTRDASRTVTRDASRDSEREISSLDIPHLGHSDLSLDAMARKVRVAWAKRVEKLGAGIWNTPHCTEVFDIARWVLSLPEKDRLVQAGRAFDAFFADEFAGKAGFPIRMFAKNPQKYLLAAPKPAATISAELQELMDMRAARERRPWN